MIVVEGGDRGAVVVLVVKVIGIEYSVCGLQWWWWWWW